jgi:hypothetical protein
VAVPLPGRFHNLSVDRMLTSSGCFAIATAKGSRHVENITVCSAFVPFEYDGFRRQLACLARTDGRR